MVSKIKKETAEATSTTTLTTKGREICMSEKEKNIVPSTAEAEMSEEEKQKLLEQFDKESKTRKFGSPVLKKAYRVFAIIVTLYHLVFASGLYMPETLKHRSIHVGMILILAFMLYPATKKASRKVIAWYDYVFIALSAAVPIYMCVDYVNIINRAGKPDMMDVVIGTLLTLVVLEATRRVCGMARSRDSSRSMSRASSSTEDIHGRS